MKKTCLILGCVLAFIGMALSWLGNRMGGETTATVNLFGRSWTVDAPFSGGGYGTASYSEPTTTLMPVDRSSQAAVEQPQVTTGITDWCGTPFSSISIDLDLGSVTIAVGDDFRVGINAWGKGYQVDHWYSGDTLYIESSDSGIHLGHDCGSEVTVYVPAGVWLDNVYVDLDLGDLTLAGLQMGVAELYLDMGSLTGEALMATGIQVEASLGGVNLYGDVGEYVDISADLGSVQLGLSRPASEYGWELEADLGSITMDGRVLGSNESVTGGDGWRWIKVDADLGSIDIDFDQDVGRRPAAVVEEVPPVEAIAGVTYVTGEANQIWVEAAPDGRSFS